MKYVKLTLNKNTYNYDDNNCLITCILGFFLKSDVVNDATFFKEWALELNKPNPKHGDTTGGNCTYLEYKDGNIYLENQHSEEEVPTRLKMSREQFIKILNEWDQKVVNADHKPKEVIIKQDGDHFFIETNN